ncbi:MAG: major facilitator superfamily domain-containing protein 7 [Chlorobi bacterium]|nr:major facilitator superfamily domain-containing protein 7 [Chlorobiota bacterium]
MENNNFRIYGYRWVVLLSFMVVVITNQLLWITFAPVTGTAVTYYGVSDLSIGLLSMIFMIVYILVSIPASWIIDTYGIRVAVGIGAALTGIFGLMRGLLAHSYTGVLVAQIGIAIGQPFILNAITSVAARWFPIRERATAAGLGTLAMYIGIATALILTPYLTIHSQINGMLLFYGIVSVIAAILFFIFVRERPPSPPCPPDREERSLVFNGLKESFRNPDFILLMIVFFVGLGIFNSVTTWIEDIVRPRGFSIIQAGNTGGLMIAGGIIGAVLIPILSDRARKRTPYLRLAVIGATLGLLGITFALSYWLLLISAFIFGFFLLSAGPVGFQYGAEVTYPAPEGTSNGLLLLMGQISGIAFIVGMDSFKSTETGSMTASLIALIGFMVISLFLCFRLNEARILITEDKKYENE